MIITFTSFVYILLGLAVVLIWMGVQAIPQGKQYTVERFGKYRTTLKPGLNIIYPFIDTVGKKISMMEEVMDIPAQEVITKDNAMIRVDGVVFSQVIDAARAAYQVKDLQLAILNLTTTNVRSVMGSMDLDEVLSKREDINYQLLKVVDNATDPWGVKIIRIEIKDISPPKDLVEAMGRQMKAEREKRASILEAEGKRQAAILQAEGEKQAAILEAEGKKEAAYREAEARERLAAAEAKATEFLSDALAKGDTQAVNYFIAQKYISALEKIGTAENQKIVFMPLDSSGVIGALGGIGELTKEVLQGSILKKK